MENDGCLGRFHHVYLFIRNIFVFHFYIDDLPLVNQLILPSLGDNEEFLAYLGVCLTLSSWDTINE